MSTTLIHRASDYYVCFRATEQLFNLAKFNLVHMGDDLLSRVGETDKLKIDWCRQVSNNIGTAPAVGKLCAEGF